MVHRPGKSTSFSAAPGRASQDIFLFLAVHGGKHSWSALKWLCDLAEFIRSNPELDWPLLFNWAEALGAVRTCRLGIYLAAELLQAEVPSSIVCAVREDAQVRRLAQHVRLRIEEPRDVDPIEGQIFNLKLKERFHDKVRYVFLQFTRYSGEEERFLPLPSTLSAGFRFKVQPKALVNRLITYTDRWIYAYMTRNSMSEPETTRNHYLVERGRSCLAHLSGFPGHEEG